MQRKALFRIVCKSKRKCFEVVIYSGRTHNLDSTKMVEKLGLKNMKHPTPYKVSSMHKGHHILVNEKCEVEFHIAKYHDKVLCDLMPMDVCHVMLGIP